jgi:hypothetical protein
VQVDVHRVDLNLLNLRNKNAADAYFKLGIAALGHRRPNSRVKRKKNKNKKPNDSKKQEMRKRK